MSRKHVFFIALILTLSGLARVLPPPTADRVKSAGLVIIGVIDSIKYAPHTDDIHKFQSDTAFIKIKEILLDKSTRIASTSTYANLIMPSIRNRMTSSNEIRYKLNQSGIWILQIFYVKYSLFSAPYPGDFLQMDYEDKVRRIILELEQDESEKTK